MLLVFRAYSLGIKTKLIPKLSLPPFNAVIDLVPRDWIIFILRVGEGDLLSKTAFEIKILDRSHYVSRES